MKEEDKKKMTPQEEAEELRKKYAKRKAECVAVSVKLKEYLSLLEAAAKMPDIDEPYDNGMAKMNLYDYVHNIIVWYPKQSVDFIARKSLPFYEEAHAIVEKPSKIVGWLSEHIHNRKLFAFVCRLFPKSMKKDILRIRSIDNITDELTRLVGMLDENTEGDFANPLGLAKIFSYLHVLYPKRTSELVSIVIKLYKKCQKVNANQIKGFGFLSKKK